jgi:hypothetical protein
LVQWLRTSIQESPHSSYNWSQMSPLWIIWYWAAIVHRIKKDISWNALESHYISRMAANMPDPNNALGKHVEWLRRALKKPLMTIPCANPACNATFKQTRHWQKYHSVKCRNEHYWSQHERMTVPTKPSQT